MSKLTIIQSQNDINNLVEYLEDKDYVAYDCETTGLPHDSEVVGISVCADEADAFYIILAEWQVDKLVYHGLDVSNLMRLLTKKNLVMHNAVYDCALAKNYFKTNLMPALHTDTMVLAHFVNENRRVGLKDLAVSIFGEGSDIEAKEMKASVLANGGSVTKDSFEMYKADPQLLAKYGAKDALLTYRLFLHLVPQLYEQGLEKFFYEDECMPLLKGPTFTMNTVGLKVDTKELTTLKKTLQTECEEAKAFVYKEIEPYIKYKYPGTNKKNQFNIGSSQQLAWLLFGELNLDFNNLTDGGKEACVDLGLKIPYTKSAKREFIRTCLEACGEVRRLEVLVMGQKTKKATKFKQPWAYIAANKAALQKHEEKHKWIKRLLEYQRKTKILSTYVEGIEERVKYGIIHPSFLQTGTTSGRYSSRAPNFQNLPRDDKRVKNCIVARAGHTLVGADFSQLEVRVFASVSQDPNLLQAFKTGEDFYSVIGIPVFGAYDSTPYKEGSDQAFGVKYKHLRKMSKEIALASTYGATAPRLASMIGKTREETQEIIDTYFEKFPKVREMMLESHAMAKKDGQVTNIFGRPRRLLEAKFIDEQYGDDEDLPYEARNMLNLAVNHRIQSTAASICNRAMIKVYNDMMSAGINANIILQVHDEIVIECLDADADNVSVLLQNAMETAVELPGVALEALPHTAKRLGDLK